MNQAFITGEWKDLLMINYAVDPELLRKYVPYGTEINLYRGKCYLTMTAFLFSNLKIKGLKVPFHQNFLEINLRFYVREQLNPTKHGVVFIKEIISKPFISVFANMLYKENYEVKPTMYKYDEQNGQLEIEYYWKHNMWNYLRAKAETKLSIPPSNNSLEQFIIQQPWGFTKSDFDKTHYYKVSHPTWQLYPLKDHSIIVDFSKVFGREFGFLRYEKPSLVFLAAGSDVEMHFRKELNTIFTLTRALN